MNNETINKGLIQGKILQVNITSTQKKRVLRFLRTSLKKKYKFFITTPNPEIILASYKDREYRSILNTSDIALVDGVGLLAAYKFLKLKTPKQYYFRIPVLIVQGIYVALTVLINGKRLPRELVLIKGREMFIDLVALANKKRLKVFLLGGKNGVTQRTKNLLSRSYKKVKIEYSDGPVLNEEGNPIDKNNFEVEKDVIKTINNFKPHILFVGFGAPKQEKWISKHLRNLDIGGVMVVGGTFDYISGKTRLPPRWIENAGFEWLWRLFTKPGHVKRVFSATIVFPYKVFVYKLNNI